jgi:hypothetical protein
MAQFTNITAEEMTEFLTTQNPPFSIVQLDNVGEMVFGRRVHGQHNWPLTLRVYTGIDGKNSRGVGDDAIRCSLFMRTRTGEILFVGGDKRVHRVKGWRQNLQSRIDKWEEYAPTIACRKCCLPMVLREGKFGKFFGCSGWKPNNKGCDYRENV